MSDITTVAVAASAPAATAHAAGLPPQLVIICAVVGAVVGVWVSRPAVAPTTTLRGLIETLGLVAAYSGVAVLAAAAWEAVAPAYVGGTGTLAALARIPAWVVSGAVAMSGFWVLPRIAARIDAFRFKGEDK